MDLEKVSREDWIVAGVALVLIIDLLAFPWFSFSSGGGHIGGLAIPSYSFSESATGAPDGWLGVLALIVAVALIADLALERLSPQTTVPAIQNSRTMTRFVLAVVTAAFLVLKFLLHIHFSYFGWGFYVTVILAAALVYLTLQARTAGSATS